MGSCEDDLVKNVDDVYVRPGADVLGTRVLQYIFEFLVLVEMTFVYSYSY